MAKLLQDTGRRCVVQRELPKDGVLRPRLSTSMLLVELRS